QEVQVQRVVGARDRAGRRFGVEPDLSVAASGLRPRHVDEDSPSDRDEPPRGVGGQRALPGGERPDERLLYGVLGRREVRTATDEDAQDPWDELAQLDVVHAQWVKVGGAARKGRTSSHSWIGSPPAPGAADSSPASSIARSWLSTSMIIHPAIKSLVSANGPSVTGGRPSPSERTHSPS